jgi:hypothetical protein
MAVLLLHMHCSSMTLRSPLTHISILITCFFKQYSASKIVKGLTLANYLINDIVLFVLVLCWKEQQDVRLPSLFKRRTVTRGKGNKEHRN